MTEDRHGLEPEVHLDESQDTEEPAFEWMRTPARSSDAETPEHAGASSPAGSEAKAGRVDPEPAPSEPAVPEPADREPADREPADREPADREPADREPADREPHATEAPAPQAETRAEARQAEARQAEARRAEARAEARQAGNYAEAAEAERQADLREPSPTSALQVRPPEDEVRRRTAQREAAAQAKPMAPRVLQVLMAIFLPFLLLIAAVRVIATPAFLWLEYFRPGFPGDGYGFSMDDRLTYGSYAVDYLSNFAGRRYLGDLVQPSGSPLFTDAEVSHMADVKFVVFSAYAAGLVLLAFFVVAFLVLRKRRGAFARGLFAGAIVTFLLVVGLAVLAVLGWEQFFTDFHRIFFSQGNWTFQLSDTLIRLFPSQFWMDAAIVIGVLTLLVSSLIIIFAWPTKKNAPADRADRAQPSERETVAE